MRKEFIPFYLSRAVLSALVAIHIMGLTWKAAIFAIILFGLFLLYLHSGWFRVDPRHPLIPLRRDERARDIQRKALIAAVVVGILVYVLQPQAANFLKLSAAAGSLSLSLGVITYFVTQFILLARA